MDNEQAAGVAILPLKPLISEGEVAEFQISTSEPLAIDSQIDFELIAVGNFLPIEIPKSVIVQANTTSATLSIPTVEDSVYEINGYLKVSILESDHYTVAEHPDNLATIAVLDNDQPDETSILAVRDTIIEGETALFEISIPMVQSIEQMLTISVSQNGEFLKSSEESRTVVMEPVSNFSSF